MRLVFSDARVWKYAIASISNIVEEASFMINSEGLRLRSLDPSKVVLVDYAIPRTGFEEFEVDGEVIVGVNLSDLSRVLKRSTKNDRLELSVMDSGRFVVALVGRGVRRFILPSIQPSIEQVPELNIQFKARAKMVSAVFRDVVSELEVIGDAIEFIAKPSERKLIARTTSDLWEAELELSEEKGMLLEFSADGEERSSYSTDYLSNIAVASQAADEALLEYATAIPCRIEFTLPEGGRLTFYVAPRTE